MQGTHPRHPCPFGDVVLQRGNDFESKHATIKLHGGRGHFIPFLTTIRASVWPHTHSSLHIREFCDHTLLIGEPLCKMANFKSMLDDLMGKDRNLMPHERSRSKRHFSDRDICKNFLAKFCFSELFQKTKLDMGPCEDTHDDQMKEMWDAYEHKERYTYESDFLKNCNRLIAEVDSRTKRLKAKHKEVLFQPACA